MEEVGLKLILKKERDFLKMVGRSWEREERLEKAIQRQNDLVGSLNIMEKGLGELNAFQFHWGILSKDLDSVKLWA